MVIKNLLIKTADKSGNAIAKLSGLSSAQVQQVNKNRQEFMSGLNDPSDSVSTEQSKKLLAESSVEIFDVYLSQLRELYKPVDSTLEYGRKFNSDTNIRYLKITKWVTDRKENSLEKLVNLYQVLSQADCNIGLVFNRKCNTTDVYLAVVNTDNANDNIDSEVYKARITEAIRGNFPGSEYDAKTGSGRLPCLDVIKDDNPDSSYSVAIATNIPTESSEKFVSQTIEKLLDGIIPDTPKKEYTIVLLATPIKDIQERKLRLASLYSKMSPYSSWQTNYTFTEARSDAAIATFGVNIGSSAGSQRTTSGAETSSEANSLSSSQTEADSLGGSLSIGAGGNAKLRNTVLPNASATISQTHTVSESAGQAITKAIAKTDALARGTNKLLNFGASFSRASNVTATVGMNEGITQSFVNYSIKHTLEVLEKQMERYDTSAALGMWDFSAYIISADHNVANNVAHSYLALTLGTKSYLSNSAINLWRGDVKGQREDAQVLLEYIRDLRHPVFCLNPEIVDQDNSFYVYPAVVLPTTALSGKELAYSLNFPKKSVTGLPVYCCAEFGRDVVSYDSTSDADNCINIGKIYHMNHIEKGDVKLSKKSLTSHTFITGSTGSGKSNTVYNLIEELSSENVSFMVIEPAKGEYKNVFGNRTDVRVYGTNPLISELLRINPFSFPNGIHVYEHMDRLVELFNVCWPMYAAMPAVLKNAIEKAYEDCGWDLVNSTNKYSDTLYPSFSDVADNVRRIIDSSDYDTENKGAYKGSLLTRLQSLTNGINGQVLTSDELSAEDIFDKNVIIDLSRVGSAETKALLMGMLIVKLQEYRVSEAVGVNQELQHVTVLEEAHNILKRTSSDQGNDGANLIGKSVEMLSNAIAEMRTYGEGFIIVDQAPGLIDMAAIRNTNTKIIMRLPDYNDRVLVGKAARLDDDQIEEIAKLPCGVAAIYQNEWIQPVLCKINRVESDNAEYRYLPKHKNTSNQVIERLTIAQILSKEMRLGRDITKEDIMEKMTKVGLSSVNRVRVLKLLEDPQSKEKMKTMGPVMYELFNDIGKEIGERINDGIDISKWIDSANDTLRSYAIEDQLRRDIIQGIVTHYLVNEINRKDILIRWREQGGLR